MSPASDNRPTASNEAGKPRRILRLHQAVTLIVGLVIGAGIFKTPAVVANLTGETGAMFSAWILGGLVSLVGALCYAAPRGKFGQNIIQNARFIQQG